MGCKIQGFKIQEFMPSSVRRDFAASDQLQSRITSKVDLSRFDLSGGELVEFDILQMSIDLAFALKRARRADGLDTAVMQDDDLRARADGRESVREENQGPALPEAGNRVVDEILNVLVEADGRLFDD